MAATNRVLVLGATGKIGEALVKDLQAKHVAVSALVRDVAKAQAALPGVTLLQGDTDKIDTVKAALAKGFDRLFLLTNNQTSEGPIAHAAKEAHVKHIVKISCFLANRDEEPGSIFAAHAHAETEVAAAGVAWTFLRPADFMQNLLGSACSVKHMGKLFHNAGDAQIASIDARDIAASAAAVLTADIAAHASRTYSLTGGEAITKAELATLIGKAVGKQVDAVHVGDVGVKNALVTQAKLPEFVAHLLVQLGIVYRLRLTGNKWHTDNVELLTGNKPRTFAAFIAENKAAF